MTFALQLLTAIGLVGPAVAWVGVARNSSNAQQGVDAIDTTGPDLESGGGPPPPPEEPPEDGDRGDGDQGPPIRWVTVATFSLSTEAHLARLRLEAAEVTCLLMDEHLVSVNWLLSPAVGGIKLQVPEDQIDAARAALGGDVVEWDESEARQLAVCGACGRGEYAPAPVPKWVIGVSVVLLGIPLLFLPRVWKCTSCGQPMPTGDADGHAP